MAQLSWISSTSGSWTTAANWSGGVAPTATDDAIIAVPNITVTIAAGALAVHTITTGQSTLSVTGGTMTVSNGVVIGGAYQQSGGDFIIQSQNASFNGGLTLSGGELQSVGQNFISGGTFSQSAGTLVLAGFGGIFNNNVNETAGLISLMSGTLGFAGAVTTLDGTIAGNGTLVVEGQADGLNGTTTIAQTTVLSIGRVAVQSGVFALSNTGSAYSYVYNGYLTATGGTVALGGNTLQLNGRATLADQISGGGTVIAKGGAQLYNLTLNNAAVLDIASAATLVPLQDGPDQVILQNNANITIASGASLQMTGNDSIFDANYNSSLLDNGLLSRTAGVGTAEILPSFTEAAGATVSIAAGSLDFSGVTNNFAGTISGNGTLSLGAYNTGQQQNFTFDPATSSNGHTVVAATVLAVANVLLGGVNTQDQLTIDNSLTYAGNWAQSGGLLLTENNPATGAATTLNLTGSVILDGGVIKSSTGTINTTGLVSLGSSPNFSQGVDIEGFTQFVVNQTVRQSASIQFGVQTGSKPTAVIAAGGSWLIEDAASITGPYGTVINNGTLAKLAGSGTSRIDGTLINNGVFNIAASQVLLDGSGTLGGTITGSGQLDLEGNGPYTLSSGVTLGVSHLLIDNTAFGANASVVSLGGNLAYAGIWLQHGGAVQLNGDTLTLSNTASLDGGTLTGPGTLTASGVLTVGNAPDATYTIGSQATLNVTKAAEQSVNLTVSALGDLNIASGATYTIDDAALISGNGSLTVAGALTSSAGGTTTIDPSVIVNGKITANEGTLAFIGSVNGTGSILAHAGTQLDLDSAVSASTTVNMSAGNAGLLIGDGPAYQGLISGFTTGDQIEIAQLASGLINYSLNSTGEVLTISDSANHTFTLNFDTAQTLSGTGSLVLSDGSNGLIGIYHT